VGSEHQAGFDIQRINGVPEHTSLLGVLMGAAFIAFSKHGIYRILKPNHE
jgi:hypothetical protein